MIQGGGVRFLGHLMRKYMDIPSVLFSFLETSLKLRSIVNEAEIK